MVADPSFFITLLLQWRHDERHCVSNHRRLDCLLKRLFKHRSKKTSKLRFTGLCDVNPAVTGKFPSQRVGNLENVSMCEGNSPGTGEFPAQVSVTRKCFHLLTSSWVYHITRSRTADTVQISTYFYCINFWIKRLTPSPTLYALINLFAR